MVNESIIRGEWIPHAPGDETGGKEGANVYMQKWADLLHAIASSRFGSGISTNEIQIRYLELTHPARLVSQHHTISVGNFMLPGVEPNYGNYRFPMGNELSALTHVLASSDNVPSVETILNLLTNYIMGVMNAASTDELAIITRMRNGLTAIPLLISGLVLAVPWTLNIDNELVLDSGLTSPAPGNTLRTRPG